MGWWPVVLTCALASVACVGHGVDPERPDGAAGAPMAGGAGAGGAAGAAALAGASGAEPGRAGNAGALGIAGNPGTAPVEPYSEGCYDPVTRGECDGDFRRYGFDPETGECKEFTYGGCGGTENNFKTQGACVESCGGCPLRRPQEGAACEPSTWICEYSAHSDCLCGGRTGFSCDAVSGEDCRSVRREIPRPVPPSPIVLPQHWLCHCTSAEWSCLK